MSAFRAERAEWVLAGALVDGVPMLTHPLRVALEDIADRRVRAIIAAVLALHAEGREVNLVTVCERLAHGCADVPPSFVATVVAEAVSFGVVSAAIPELEAEIFDARRRALLDSIGHALRVIARDPTADLETEITVLVAALRGAA